MRYLAFVFILFICFSCSQSEKERNILFTGVDVDKTMAIKSSPFISKERVRSLDMGPINVEGPDQVYDEKIENKKVIALYLGPGLHKSFAYIPVISCLKRMDLDFHIIAGAEFSAMIASLYAYDLTAEEIDWKLYQMSEEIKNKTIYSKDWSETIVKFVDKEFKNKRIQGATKVLAVAEYDLKKKKNVLTFKGNLKTSLLNNLSLTFSGNNVNSVFGSEDDIVEELKKRADYVIVLDVLGDKLKLNSINDYLYGVYGKLIGHNIKFDTRADLKLKIPVDEFELDTEKIGDVIQVGKEYCKKVESFLTELKDKKEE
ncbi:hypothetical protein M899_3420 [Bacteriovorax sp. BSW11_IV]|uniref:hypothetical protein n=1 Tax=Bacteriovorax sp. BSW11_IV TaxID=1353529 RepID=UPI00038A38D6|nr:hypothetical protein [Bacteriovorax sp. BSW11_IV]EQC45129.1 hypothetical protein M899_3420 [Bacteriovorax sp. BSW11_IV]